jgi:hypothetical protein
MALDRVMAALQGLAQQRSASFNAPAAGPTNDRVSNALQGLAQQRGGSFGSSQPLPPPPGSGPNAKGIGLPNQKAPKGSSPKGNLSKSDFNALGGKDKLAYLNAHTDTSGVLGFTDSAAQAVAHPLGAALNAFNYPRAAVQAWAAASGRAAGHNLDALGNGDPSGALGLASQGLSLGLVPTTFDSKFNAQNLKQSVSDIKNQTGAGQYLERSTKNGANPVARIGAEALGTIPAGIKAGGALALRAAQGNSDPTQGLGKQFAADQSSIGKRLAGGIGDLATDPLVLLGPESGLSGAAADRSTLAARFMEPDVIARLGGEDAARAASQKVLRGGLGAVDSETVGALTNKATGEAQKGGLFLGHGDTQVQVLPHGVSRVLSAPFRAAKTAGSDIIDALRPGSVAHDAAFDYSKLARAGDVNANLAKRAAAGTELGAMAQVIPLGHDVVDTFKNVPAEQRATLYDAMEGHQPSQDIFNAAAKPGEAAAHEKLRGVFDGGFNAAEQSRINLESKGVITKPLSKIEDYVPHQLTEDAKAAVLQDGKTGLRKTVADSLQSQRKLVAGADLPWGDTIPANLDQKGVTDYINQSAQKHLGFQYFDKESLPKIAASYLQQTKNYIAKNDLVARELDLGVRKLDPTVAAADQAALAGGRQKIVDTAGQRQAAIDQQFGGAQPLINRTKGAVAQSDAKAAGATAADAQAQLADLGRAVFWSRRL